VSCAWEDGATWMVADTNIPPLFFAPNFLAIVFLFGILYAPCDFTLAYLRPSTTPFVDCASAGVDWIAGRHGSANVASVGLQEPATATACNGRCN
jgi:hypothetical protein